MQSTEQHDKVLKAITEKVKAIVPRNAEVILFGSQARGDADEDSDWDILILLDKDRVTPDDIDEYGYPLREMGWDYNENINAILYSKSQWAKENFTPFYKNVTKDGIKLWA